MNSPVGKGVQKSCPGERLGGPLLPAVLTTQQAEAPPAAQAAR